MHELQCTPWACLGVYDLVPAPQVSRLNGDSRQGHRELRDRAHTIVRLCTKELTAHVRFRERKE